MVVTKMEAVTVGLSCTLDEEDRISILNIGAKAIYNVAAWKTDSKIG
jgi:hypothetical protein